MAEYLWRELGWDQERGKPRRERVPIVRKTRAQVFVVPYVFADGTRDPRLDALDRRELETTGKATAGRRAWGQRTYYTAPE
jgi:hypothetical protein